jgi:hypothetical protein
LLFEAAVFVHRIYLPCHQQARFEFDRGLIIPLLEVNYLQTNPADGVIQDQILRSVIDMPGLPQIVVVMQHIGTVTGTHQLLSIFREHPM